MSNDVPDWLAGCSCQIHSVLSQTIEAGYDDMHTWQDPWITNCQGKVCTDLKAGYDDMHVWGGVYITGHQGKDVDDLHDSASSLFADGTCEVHSVLR